MICMVLQRLLPNVTVPHVKDMHNNVLHTFAIICTDATLVQHTFLSSYVSLFRLATTNNLATFPLHPTPFEQRVSPQ
jgi:hypothetical protein